jgi:hypothetical protein
MFAVFKIGWNISSSVLLIARFYRLFNDVYVAFSKINGEIN